MRRQIISSSRNPKSAPGFDPCRGSTEHMRGPLPGLPRALNPAQRGPGETRHGLRVRGISGVAFAAVLGTAGGAWAGQGTIDNGQGTVDLEFNFRFPPTSSQITQAREQLQNASGVLCDALDGQLRIGKVTFTAGGPRQDQADFWFHADPGRSSSPIYTDGSSLVTPGQHVTLLAQGLVGDVMAHELGHYILGLGDQYDEQRRWGSGCGIGPGFDSGTIDERNPTIMQQSGSLQCATAALTGS